MHKILYMMRIYSVFILFFSVTIIGFGQILPKQWAVKNNNIVAGQDNHNDIYNEDKVEEIRLYFSQADYWAKMTQNYNAKIDIPVRLVYKGISYDSVGIRFKGQTSYSRNNTQKKSFNISMDSWKEDQELLGYKTLNLNNAFEDNSYMREVMYNHFIRKYTHSAKGNFIRLYINDEDWGIYSNIQQLNKTFLKEWYTDNDGINIRADRPDGTSITQPGGGGPGGMWGDGTAGMNYLGSDTTLYKPHYDLKSSEIENPWQKLVEATNILNNTPIEQRESVFPQYFDIDKILWHLACENVFVDDDSYIFKGKMDYYLYYDKTTQRWTSYEYDGNSSISISRAGQWNPFYNAEKVNYPLLNKILAVPAFRQKYLAYYRTVMGDVLNDTNWANLIDKYDGLIKDIVAKETKKGINYTQYQTNVTSLKTYSRIRRSYLLTNSELNTVSPTISELKYTVNGTDFGSVSNKDQVTVTVKANFIEGISKVNLHYGIGIDSKRTEIEMKDDGRSGDKIANDGVFTATIPAQRSTSLVCFYTEAIAKNGSLSRAYLPAQVGQNLMFYNVQGLQNNEKTVVINEFMASNTGIIKDPSGESEDWIELYNLTDQDINMSGYYISDNFANAKKFRFTNSTIIKAKNYLVLWADENGSQGPLHLNFKLSAGGESIILSDSNSVILDSLTFGSQTSNKSAARKPNGTGSFAIGDHTFGKTNGGGLTNTLLEESEKLKLLIYPIPNAGDFHIENPSDQERDIQIFDALGRSIRQLNLKTKERIFVEGLHKGVYFVYSEGKSEIIVVN
jgi:spore coat protein CotH